MSEHGWQCDAFVEGPEGSTLCLALANFLVERASDSVLASCDAHLGPLLAQANNVLWPPVIKWVGTGTQPASAISLGPDEVERFDCGREASPRCPPL